MANPKRRHSTRRRDLKRAHKKVKLVGMAKCPTCSSFVLPHRVCKQCGYYSGKQVLNISVNK